MFCTLKFKYKLMHVTSHLIGFFAFTLSRIQNTNLRSDYKRQARAMLRYECV